MTERLLPPAIRLSWSCKQLTGYGVQLTVSVRDGLPSIAELL